MQRTKERLEEYGCGRAMEKAAQLAEYRDGLLEWNKKVNLTRITNNDEFEVKHVLDSLAILGSPELEEAKDIIDLGTGGGFPGVPLAVVCPDKNFTLIDSSAKKLEIVEKLCGAAGIKNVRTIHGRAEDLGRRRDLREKFDLCVTRAVAQMNVLSEYGLPFLKAGGSMICYKGSDIEEEIAASETAAEELGGCPDRIELVDEYGLNHNLVYILKETRTPDKYPRAAGKPGKRPL